MAHVIGKGRYIGETYPGRSSGGGGDNANRPLSQEWWVDPGTITPPGDQNGAIDTPFATIDQAFAEILARPQSASDVYGIMLAAGEHTVSGAAPAGYAYVIASAAGAVLTGTLTIAADASIATRAVFEGTDASGCVLTLSRDSADATLLVLADGGVAPQFESTGDGQITVVFFEVTADDDTPRVAANVSFAIRGGQVTYSDGTYQLLQISNAAASFESLVVEQLVTIMSSFQATALAFTGWFSDGPSYASAVQAMGAACPHPTTISGAPFQCSTSFQDAAASATDRVIGNAAGNSESRTNQVARVGIAIQEPFPAAGESMTIDVERVNADGTSATILAAPVVIDNATAVNFIEAALAAEAATALASGAGIQVVRTYVAGGGPAPMGPTTVQVYTGF